MAAEAAASTRREAERAERQQGMNELQVLLDDARHHPDGTVKVTQQRLATLTGLSRGRVQYLLRGPMRRSPAREDLEAIAKGLELDLTKVQRVAGKVFGWHLYATRDERMEVLVASAQRLGDHELQAVQALVDALSRADC